MRKLIFDFDGTLVDSMPTWGNKMLYVLQKRGVSYPDDIVRTLTPLGDVGSAEYFVNVLKIKASRNELITDMDEYAYPKYRDEILAKPSVIETLNNLRSQGYSLNVLTASPHRMLDPCLKRLNLFELFDNVWSCEDFNTTKSNPLLYQKVAEILGSTTKDCVFFDDNFYALTVAKNTGMSTVGVYDESSYLDTQKIKDLSDTFIYDFSELNDVKLDTL